MTTTTVQKGPLMWLGLMVLVVLLGLCTIFASVVTARVDRCGLDQKSTGRREGYHIHCRLSYAVGAERNVTNVYSRDVPSRNVWQYPPNQIGPLEEWVDEHPPGTPIVVRYDPADHAKVVLVGANMPLVGPRTQNNVKLLEFLAASFLVLLMIARITRPRSVWQSGSITPGLSL
jgi:hypothetical protein